MTSEARIHKFLSTPIRIEDFYNELVNLLNEHAEEQREMCANAVIDELRSMGFQIYQLGEARIRKACLEAINKKT